MFRARAIDPIIVATLAAGLTLALSPGAFAPVPLPLPGTYVVDPAGGADFTDLQTALDAVPADSTVVVRGDWGGWIPRITKSVSIVGLHITGFYNYPSKPDDAAIEVDAGADARVTFYGLHIDIGPTDSINGPRGINIRSAGDVVISDSTILCSYVNTSLYDYYARDGDGVVVYSAKSLYILRSTIHGGSRGEDFYLCDYGNEHGPDGGDAVQAGDVVVVDSELKGGDGGFLVRDCADCSDTRAVPGIPGRGLVCRSAYLSNSTVVAGSPGYGWLSHCEPYPGTPSGPNDDIDGERIDLPDALHGNDAVMGQPLHVNGDGYAPDELVLLFFSTSIGPALPLKQGPWLLEWPIVLVGVLATDDAGGFALDGVVPKDPQIEGKPFFLQAFAASRVSEPVVYVPWQPHY
jgi:hypothetical protein